MWILLPKSNPAESLKVSACPDKDLTRILGSFKDIAKLSTQAQAKIQIEPVNVGDLSCGAGDVSFEIDTAYNDKKNAVSLKLAPVYFGTFGAQFTFDFTRSGDLSTQTNAKGTSIITRNTNALGPKIVPVFMLHPFGYSIEHPSVLGTLVNPTLGLDLDNITTSFYVGDSVCLWNICLAAGAHFHEIDELTPASGLKVGDAFDPTKGALPTQKGWSTSDGGVGFQMGVTLDINTTIKLLGNATK